MARIFSLLGWYRRSGFSRLSLGFKAVIRKAPPADEVEAAWLLRQARRLYLGNRLPEWLYKASLKLAPKNWYPAPQAFLLNTSVDGRTFQILHCTSDTLGREAWLYGYYDRLVLGFMRELANQIRTHESDSTAFYDVGANIGNHSVFLSDLFDHVYCFEPNPKALEILKQNMAPIVNAEIFPVGLSKTDNELAFATGSATNLGNAHIVSPAEAGSAAIKISVRNGDSFIRAKNLTPPTMLKIDVEGYEAEVLAGLEATIAAYTPIIVFEVLPRALRKAEAFGERLRKSGYTIFKMSGLSRVRQLINFRNRLVLAPYAFDGPCENALAIPPRYWDALKELNA